LAHIQVINRSHGIVESWLLGSDVIHGDTRAEHGLYGVRF
jgi:hypothetical protein